MEIQDYRKKYNEIARDLMEYFCKTMNGQNIIFSPMSIVMLLGIVADLMPGKGRDEILDVIGKDLSYDELMTILKQIQFDSTKSESLLSSNALCVKEEIRRSILSEYPKRLKDIFDGELFVSSDFVTDINEWIKKKMKGMIHTAVDDSVNQMQICLLNAILFEAEWKEQYDEEYDIYEGDFNNIDGTTTKVQMMESEEEVYIEDAFFNGFVKPYKEEKYAFMALLPKKKDLCSLLKAIRQIDFTNLFDHASKETVKVTMPEFKSDCQNDLTDFFKELGMKTLFASETESSEWMKMTSILHKAHIEVDRKGTKAQALAIAYALACVENVICLNRPFIYAILNTETRMPVFVGLYNQANQSLK